MFRRGNERSEAIGAGAPRQNPFRRAKIADTHLGYLLFLCFGRDLEPEGFGDAAKKARSHLSLPKSRARRTILGTARSGQNFADAEYPPAPAKTAQVLQIGYDRQSPTHFFFHKALTWRINRIKILLVYITAKKVLF